ncbi:hypothetical protein J7M02_04770, partial [Candidatus Aerophobetes bacterium]|nr:hypothetical protein [Candidatus Aerophobetes bacterium]
MGFNFKFVYGMPNSLSQGIKEEIKQFSKAAYTVSVLSKARVGMLGYAAMGMYTGTFDHIDVRKKIGVEVEHLGQYVLVKRVDEISDEQVKELVSMAKRDWEIEPLVTEEDLKKAMKIYIALKDISIKFNWSALTVKCQYELSKYYKTTPCIGLSLLADELPCSCEGDILLIITQLMMYYLTGNPVA